MSDLGNKEIMAQNIKYYLNINQKSQTEICQTLGFAMSTFSDWVHARSYPRIDKIELMANYFGIEKSDLVENHSTKKNSTDIYQLIEENLDKSTAEAVKSYYRLDAEDRAEVRGEMKYMLKADKYNQESELKNA